MKKTLISTLSLIVALLVVNHLSCYRNKTINIWYHESESTQVEFAARELSSYLERIYPDSHFRIKNGKEPVRRGVFIATEQVIGALDENHKLIGERGGFRIFCSKNKLHLIGSDPAGVLYAVYALLESEGCNFHLSFEELPQKTGPFNLNREPISDNPLSQQRIVFNWHNFLSGCTGWNLEDWESWISQAAKMRFNGIAVHAYGNNPMFNFSYNGQEKPAGFIANTARGRDWGTEHVNDVRRLIGGEIFRDSIWGADISKVLEKDVKTETVKLMKKVFECADRHAMDVYFAFDLSTPSANPSGLTSLLPQEAKIISQNGEIFANPDTKEGYAYYRSQIRWLLENYPQIDVLAPWVRMGDITPDGNALSPEKMPDDWSIEYNQLMASRADSLDHPFSEGVFFLSKILRAYKCALSELGRGDIKLATGTWNWDSFMVFDKIIDPEVMFIPIDWSINFDFPETKAKLRQIAPGRTLIPVIWPHHDDYAYIGSPQVPYDHFQQKLDSCSAEGFGIIHWTTRPLDLYFTSISKQVWEKTQDYNHQTATREMSRTQFGLREPILENYLDLWLREGPKFGRETYDYFYDNHAPDWLPEHYHLDKLQECSQELNRSHLRLKLLNKIHPGSLPEKGQYWYAYYKGMEEFFILFFESQSALINSQEAYLAGNPEKAEALSRDFKELEAVRKYAEFIQNGGLNKGEEATLISLNLRWLPDFQNMRQVLGLSPLLINFHPTSLEPLAQVPGNFTFYYAKDSAEPSYCIGEVAGNWTAWKHLADKPVHSEERLLSGIESDSIIELKIRPMREITLSQSREESNQFSPGIYRVKCLFQASKSGQSSKFKLRLTGGADSIEEEIVLNGNMEPVVKEIQLQLGKENILLRLEPMEGKASICGIEIQKLQDV